MLTRVLLLSASLLISVALAQPADIQRGRYLIQVAGCNDCHTPGYGMKGGQVDESLWLTGDRTGWYGPWGTTYSTNLRLYMDKLDEAQWLALARGMITRPPMPWFNLRAMTDEDLRAIYRYVRYLGPAGEPEPGFVPPGSRPDTFYVDLMPRMDTAAWTGKAR